MPTFNQKLAEAQKAFKAAEGSGAYKRHALPEVLAYLKAYIAMGPYPYNAEVVKFILSKETVEPALHDYLDTEVYLAQHDLTAERDAARDAEMTAQGYLKLKPELEYRGPARIVAKKDADIFTRKVESVGKIVDGGNGYAFFIPKGRRTRGYSLFDLKGYYQPITA